MHIRNDVHLTVCCYAGCLKEAIAGILHAFDNSHFICCMHVTYVYDNNIVVITAASVNILYVAYSDQMGWLQTHWPSQY